jgi:hypothetical protein
LLRLYFAAASQTTCVRCAANLIVGMDVAVDEMDPYSEVVRLLSHGVQHIRKECTHIWQERCFGAIAPSWIHVSWFSGLYPVPWVRILRFTIPATFRNATMYLNMKADNKGDIVDVIQPSVAYSILVDSSAKVSSSDKCHTVANAGPAN